MYLLTMHKGAQAILFTVVFGPIVQLADLHGEKKGKSAVLSGFVFGYYLILMVLPIHWMAVLIIHLSISLILAVRFKKSRPVVSYAIPRGRTGIAHGFSVGILCLFPLIYLTAFFRHYFNAVDSVHLPQSIFSVGFQWCLMASPFVAGGAVFFWRKGIRFSTTNVLYFYLGLSAIVIFPFIMNYGHTLALQSLKVNIDAPVYFGYHGEGSFRSWVMGAYLIGAVFFLIPFVVLVFNGRDFFRRIIGVGGYSAWLILNILLVSGESNYYITAARIWAFDTQHFKSYRMLSQSLHRRLPESAEGPFLLNSMAELEYQFGNREKAQKLWRRLESKYHDRDYLGELTSNVRHILDQLDSAKQGDSAIYLDVPVVQSADYLSIDWYGVLSAVAHLNPELSDLKLKEKLLKIFSLEEHQLPTIENIPALIPTLHRLEVTSSALFLNETSLKRALRHGAVPLIYFNYTWVPIVGYDAERQGYLYYDYSYNTRTASEKKSEDRELIFGSGTADKKRKLNQLKKYTFQKFIPAHRLAQHLVNIGGVGLVIGDTSFIDPAESKAAYLIEKGDIYYQSQNNFNMAARCYLRAYERVPNWIVLERMGFLKRYWTRRDRRETGVKGVFARVSRPKWLDNIPINDSLARQIEQRVYQGDAGYILMEQWLFRPALRDSLQLDSAVTTYAYLHEKEPYNPDYLDTLASLYKEKGDYQKSEQSFKKLFRLYNKNDYRIAMEIAWLNLLQKHYDEIPQWIKYTKESVHPAKFMTLEAARYLTSGKGGKAEALLTQSLKNDKTLGETHLLMADYYESQGDDRKKELHLKWYRRCRGII